MRPKQRKVAAKNMLELRTAEVDADSVGSDTSLSAACRCCKGLRFVLCQDEFSKVLLRRGTRFWAAPRVDGASETQFLSSFRDVEQLFQTGKTSKICNTFACFV